MTRRQPITAATVAALEAVAARETEPRKNPPSMRDVVTRSRALGLIPDKRFATAAAGRTTRTR